VGRGVDAAIFGSGAVTCIASIGGGDQPSRSHVARESAAFRLLLPCFSLLSLSSPCLWIPLALKKRRSNQKLEEISVVVMHNYTRTVEPTKERRFIDTHFWLKNGDSFAVPLQIRGALKYR